ncbi:MAG: hypothetical protein IJW64_05110 [Clostridia bacterium]|nr:hypothetical protein [Clostridia bacterium]
MKNMKKRLLVGALILSIAVVVSAVVVMILAMANVLPADPFKLCFAVLTLGIGSIFAIYGAVVKGGYETAVGFILLTVGVVIVLIGLVKWYLIVVIACALLVIGLIILMLGKTESLQVTTTDQEPNFKPYSEVLEEKKEQDKIKESEPLPELKDYSKKD